MDIPSLIIGGGIAVAVLMLELRNPAIESDDDQTQLDQKYFNRRYRRRRLVHGILMLIAVIAMWAGVIGQGRTFALMWAAVPLLILVVVLLAMLDAQQTFRYHREKLPEVQRAAFESVTAGDEDSVADDNDETKTK